MPVLVLIIWLAVFFHEPGFGLIQYTRETMPGARFYDGKKINIPVSTEDGLKLYERWVHQGISGLMSAVAKKRAENLNEYHRNKLYRCSRNAENIVQQARCVVQAIDAKSHSHSAHHSAPARLETLKNLLRDRRRSISLTVTTDVIHRFIFRTKRAVVNRYNYKLMSEYETKTPFGILGKYLSRTIRVIKKKKNRSQSWSTMISRIETMQTTIERRKKLADVFKKRLKFDAYRESNLSSMKELPKNFLQQAGLEGVNADGPEMERVTEIVKMLRGAVKLAMVMNGDNSTVTDNRTIKVGSPRLLSLVPRGNKDDINLLSPSLFSLHDRGKGLEKLTSVPHLLKSVVDRDFDEWLNFIAEASGATDAVDRMEKQVSEPEVPEPWSSMPRGIDGQPMYFTKENISEFGPEQVANVKLFEKITKSVTPQQIRDFNTTGYSLLTREQIIRLYGPGSPYNNSAIMNRFLAIRPENLHDQIIQTIRHMAKINPDSPLRRRKRAVILSPLLLTAFIFDPAAVSTPIILSPVVLTPLVFSPAILGPVILSPWVFVPIIFAPRLMCPAIVSPAILSVFVLSPVILDPFILSPGVMVPYILSPKLLSPVILSPSVMTPMVLTPFCLSPAIMSPTALTALVLSPFVLSPFIYSPAYIATLIFSPNAFSPLINSTGKGVTEFFSPSAFS